MASASAKLGSIHSVIREAPEVASHLKQTEQLGRQFYAGYGGGAVVWVYETMTMDNTPSGAERLKLAGQDAL